MDRGGPNTRRPQKRWALTPGPHKIGKSQNRSAGPPNRSAESQKNRGILTMLIAPTALSLAMPALFLLALKGSDTGPHTQAAEPVPEHPKTPATGAATR
jgi:hypothetical protein